MLPPPMLCVQDCSDPSDCDGACTDAGVGKVGENCPQLTTLDLNGCNQITDHGWIELLGVAIGEVPTNIAT